MLAAGRARRRGGKEPIVFLGWEPHPMNANFEHDLSDRRRRRLRPELRRRHGLHQRPRRLLAANARMSASCCRTCSSRCRWRTRSWARSSTTARSPRRPPTEWLKANPDVARRLARRRDDPRRRATACAAVKARSASEPAEPARRRGPARLAVRAAEPTPAAARERRAWNWLTELQDPARPLDRRRSSTALNDHARLVLRRHLARRSARVIDGADRRRCSWPAAAAR